MERVDMVSTVTKKDLPTGVTIYLIAGADGTEFSTRDRNMAQVAEGARNSGISVLLDYDERKNDRGFTNRYLNSVTLTPEVNFPAPEPQPAGLFNDTAPPSSVVGDKDLQIAKAVGLKAGVDVMQYLPEAERTVSNVVTAAEFFTNWLVTWKP